ncbi:type II secretion system F family protein [Pseudonocardia sp. GCM10023141]|uniref:type II secretion system F family protein n=1 Tax=Pseudonocardia sp. GCM10023141 TaxID=3252653 RepID=UPI003611FDBB
MTPGELAVAAGAACLMAAIFVVIGVRGDANDSVAIPASRASVIVRRMWAAAGDPSRPASVRRQRVLVWGVLATAIWAVSGWPIAGIATLAAGLWLPWLLGSRRIVSERIEKLEALEAWCRRMADTLTGGGAIGLAQAVAMFDGVTPATRADEPIAGAVSTLAQHLRDGDGPDAHGAALRRFADDVDDRAGDTVAAALLLALHQQSSGVALVLRQLADGVARDVRVRRDIEAARAESRQSIRLLLIIQGGVLVLLAIVPTFAAPYSTMPGQIVMLILLIGTAGLLVWMRRLSLGTPAPRFFGNALAQQGRQS